MKTKREREKKKKLNKQLFFKITNEYFIKVCVANIKQMMQHARTGNIQSFYRGLCARQVESK